ncbi:TetR/AcrR family transcriptional regulator [Amycolatopsis sp. NPDC058278]|uniref:TetR/AcrR family transcriptional regulator n=1 Tax=Amycolatopsis sp. NPDC058278 TaxID=3346417 RepID=UPI0036DAF9DB
MPDPRLRADAWRDRQNLLVAAETAFNPEGAGASLDDIARAAGVGNATLYRHFPTRQQLIDAVYGSASARSVRWPSGCGPPIRPARRCSAGCARWSSMRFSSAESTRGARLSGCRAAAGPSFPV